MTVFVAMLIGAYRELNSRKLFWITLVISGMVVISYGSIGFNKEGMSVLFGLKQIDSEFLNSETPWARALYLGIFSDFIVTVWLSWVAVILALISTCTIFPDFLAGGAVDVVLSKPISRITLFGLKYITSLLFVVLQVGLFCVGIFLCVGLRIGEWNWIIFGAVPVVAVFYSYLFSVSVLTAVLTRSAITSLLLTLLFWVSLWSVQTTEGMLNQFKIRFEIQTEESEARVGRIQESIVAIQERDDEADAQRLSDLERQMIAAQESRDKASDARAKLVALHAPIRIMMILLPKNQQTVGMLSRWLKDPDGFSISGMMRGDMSGSGTGVMQDRTDVEMTRRLEKELDSFSAWYVVGTSLAFEGFVLGIACLIFVRRDY